MVSLVSQPFHLLIKPSGAACNLACEYCFYLEKTAYYPQSHFRMDEATLERVTEAYLQTNPAAEVTFGWQGGEPLLLGVDFFRTALALQRKHLRPGQRVTNALQTNGTLITEEWAEFFKANDFLVGVSIDGPAALHDRYRHDRGGKPTHAKVVAGIQTLQQHAVEFNALVTVNRANADAPLDVYRHLTGLGIEHLQFIPIVERESPKKSKVTSWSVRPEAFGDFLCTVFQHWARHDVGRVFVQLFECALSVWMGGMPTLCVFQPTCGRALAVEHTGDLYACDHFVYPEHLRGQTTAETMRDLVDGPAQRAFGQEKAHLPTTCKRCPVLKFCHGDCPKHRLRDGGDAPLSYLCPAYQRFFTESAEILQAMAFELRAGRPAFGVMEMLQLRDGQ
jgi:uncharacterized protein